MEVRVPNAVNSRTYKVSSEKIKMEKRIKEKGKKSI
jgi:hypothetical protein